MQHDHYTNWTVLKILGNSIRFRRIMIFVIIVTIIFNPYISHILQNNDKIPFLGSSLQNRTSCHKIHIEQSHGQSIKLDYINHLHNVKATTSRQLKIGPVQDLSVLKKMSPTTFSIRRFLVSYLVTKLRHSRNLPFCYRGTEHARSR